MHHRFVYSVGEGIMPAKCVSEISKRNVNSIHSSERSSKLEGLMARVQEGDAEAFKEVIKELWPKAD